MWTQEGLLVCRWLCSPASSRRTPIRPRHQRKPELVRVVGQAVVGSLQHFVRARVDYSVHVHGLRLVPRVARRWWLLLRPSQGATARLWNSTSPQLGLAVHFFQDSQSGWRPGDSERIVVSGGSHVAHVLPHQPVRRMADGALSHLGYVRRCHQLQSMAEPRGGRMSLHRVARSELFVWDIEKLWRGKICKQVERWWWWWVFARWNHRRREAALSTQPRHHRIWFSMSLVLNRFQTKVLTCFILTY